MLQESIVSLAVLLACVFAGLTNLKDADASPPPVESARADYCAVEVRAADEAGRPVVAPVELLDSGSRLITTLTTDQKGVAHICDMGFGTHRILVGRGSCHPVLINDVSVFYPEPVRYSVTLRRCPNQSAVASGTCGVTLP